MNAMEGMDNITIDQQINFLEVINSTLELQYTTETVESIRNRLWYIYSMSAQYKEDDAISESSSSSHVEKERQTKLAYSEQSSMRSASPVSVATSNGHYHRQ